MAQGGIRLFYGFGFFCLLLAGLWLFGQSDLTAAVIRLPREGMRIFAAQTMEPGERLVLSYRHSVEKGLVQGVFAVGPYGKLLAVETRMESVGTGLPNQAGPDSRRKGGLRVVDQGNREMDGFRFFLSPINRTQISMAGNQVDLTKLRPGTVLLIDAEKVNRLKWWLWRLAGTGWPAKGDES